MAIPRRQVNPSLIDEPFVPDDKYGQRWQQDERGMDYTVDADGSKRFNAPTLTEQKQSRPGDNFFRDTHWDEKTGKWKKTTNWSNIIGLAAMVPTGVAAGQALAGAGASAGATGATGAGATSAAPASSLIGAAPALGSTAPGIVPGVTLGSAGVEGLPMAASGWSGAASTAGKYLAKNPTLLLAAASMLGGDGTQHRQSYKGDLTSPEHSLYNALAATYRSGQGMMDKKPVRLRGLLPDAPQPVSIPGLGFQIGGGMGHNPAQDDMEVDSMDGYRQQNPFGDVAKKTRL